ncbi:hypothetical protein GDO81_019409 [Engystomops pustulosus]|uniref:Uncharacterized protein n=1 Tax=Engystomops pustulosus TaxID=76066 RepID=A0AAV6ZI74_ENGPU|nr:hypothetical protein GDO81_019409 [Engystomops pustulosus]
MFWSSGHHDSPKPLAWCHADGGRLTNRPPQELQDPTSREQARKTRHIHKNEESMRRRRSEEKVRGERCTADDYHVVTGGQTATTRLAATHEDAALPRGLVRWRPRREGGEDFQ